MLTTAALRAYTQKDLAQMAKRRGVRGWHSMRKDDLVRALLKAAKREATHNGNGTKTAAKRTVSHVNGSKNGSVVPSSEAASGKQRNGHAAKALRNGRESALVKAKPKSPAITRRIEAALADRESRKDIAQRLSHTASEPKRERVVLMVRDPYWLHVHWELTKASVERARAALAENWHTARPILRLYEVDAGTTTNATARIVRDIEIHGGVQNWYIDVAEPPQSFVVEVGYLCSDGRFHSITRSNSVTTPRPGLAGATDENWADVAANCEKIYALSGGYSSESGAGELQQLFEERLKRPMGSPMNTRYGMGAERFLGIDRDFALQVEAELIIYGATKPTAYVMLGGEPIKVNPDGTFSVRMDLGNARQVIPVVAESADGVEQRTVVVAVERNTKIMEPVMRDPNEQ